MWPYEKKKTIRERHECSKSQKVAVTGYSSTSSRRDLLSELTTNAPIIFIFLVVLNTQKKNRMSRANKGELGRMRV